MGNIDQYQQLAATYITELGTKLLAGILFWLVGADAGAVDHGSKSIAGTFVSWLIVSFKPGTT